MPQASVHDEQSGTPPATEERRRANRSSADRPGIIATALGPHRLAETGTEPDPRFTFANERTFLAWNRTALALIAGGLAAAQFLHFDHRGLRLLIAVPLIVLGAVLGLASYREWIESERAMRLGRPLPYSTLPKVLVAGVSIIAMFGTAVALIDRIVH